MQSTLHEPSHNRSPFRHISTMTLDIDSEPTHTPPHDDTNEQEHEDDEEEITSKVDDEITSKVEEEDALALLARSKARITEVEAGRPLEEGNEPDGKEEVCEGEMETLTPSESETNETPAVHNQHSEFMSPPPVEVQSPARTVHLKAKPSNLAEEAAALLAMSKARLMNGETSQDGARSSSSGAVGVEVVRKQSMMIKPLEDDEVIESSSEEEEEVEGEEEVEVEHLDGTDEFETRVSEKSSRGDKDLQQVGADVSMNGHKAQDVVDQSLSNSEEDEEEDEIDDEAIQSQARAYAAAMLTVANVSESHNKRSTHREDDTIKKSSQGEQMEDVKSFVDTKYLNNLDALPPHLINALLHEEAMFAAEKAALEGKDRHVFDLKQASDLSSELQRQKEEAAKKSSSSRDYSFVTGIRKWVKKQRLLLQHIRLEQQRAEQNRKLNQARQEEAKSRRIRGGGPTSPLDLNIPRIPPAPSSYPYILTQDIFKALHHSLPASLLYSQWNRIYCLAQHGDAFEVFMRLSEKVEKTVLIVKSTKGDIFGGFVDNAWKRKGNDQFYGGGQSLLFRLDDDELNNRQTLHIYKWTGVNRYIQLCDVTRKKIAMGGGGSNFGLCIEDDFRRGSTHTCETFGNEPLCSGDGTFDVLDLEIWGFGGVSF
mmetsp:Transcript_19113/g.24811  ORF Transcript_19113/g.24811 Transcript_19113/m.24811 type:complete len:653 (-) Transcript_19113:234-2192(-)